jgi:hypothetical protein
VASPWLYQAALVILSRMTICVASTLSDLGDWVTIVTGPLALVGIWLAWLQLRRTADATEATKEAVEKTARGLAIYQLLALIPQVQQQEADLDVAVKLGDESRALEVLNHYRRTATEIRGLLDSRPTDDDGLLDLMQESFTDAFQAKRRLMAGTSDLAGATLDVSQSIAEVSVRIGTLAGQLKANIGGDAA